MVSLLQTSDFLLVRRDNIGRATNTQCSPTSGVVGSRKGREAVSESAEEEQIENSSPRYKYRTSCHLK